MSRSIVRPRPGLRVVVACVVLLGCGDEAPDTGIDASVQRDASAHDAGDAEPSSEDSGAEVDAAPDEDAGGRSPVCPPGPTDVGPTDASILVPTGSLVVRESGTVIENVDLTGDITITDGARDVTIRNFRIRTDGYWGISVEDGSSAIIEDGEIDGLGQTHDAIRGSGYTARRLFIHDVGGDSFKAGSGTVIECNYVTSIGQGEGAHGDGVQLGGANIRIDGNNFELTSGELTGCIFPGGIGPITGPVHVGGNRFNGGGWVVYCDPQMHMTDNVFGPIYGYGPVTGECATWSGNVWEATGETIPGD